MVNGNYALYGDRPSSESEIVDDHVHPRTVDRKNKRKANRTANELQHTLNMAQQRDNETDSVKYEKKIKEPRLLRYVPTTDVEEHFVSEKFETYDLKPTEERPRRYTFTKKPKNPADGSVNYAYSRSSSSCSSPNGNLPTISEHGEQYGTYKVRSGGNPTVEDLITGYESKLDKYFAKPREVKPFAVKGSHPDSLYRVAADGSVGAGRMVRTLRLLRWPAALLAVCIALAVFVYFLMPDNFEAGSDKLNMTYWEPETVTAAAESQHGPPHKTAHTQPKHTVKPENNSGTKTSEIDFYDAESDKKDDIMAIIDSISNTIPQRKLPITPVFPSHITPEVQYGNERVDSEKMRTPKVLDKMNTLPDESTLKPHITQKPEKPLAIFFKHDNDVTSSTTEYITKAETFNDFTNYDEKETTRHFEEWSRVRPQSSTYKEFVGDKTPAIPTRTQPELPPEIQEFYNRQPASHDLNFTSGHSKLFGISMEDAEKMKSTTQSSLYNTRVSPTLPTWRDGDDTTTKKYPTNVYTDVPQCGSTRLALCRGVLPYDLAGSSAIVGGVEINLLIPQIDYLVSTNCSDRVRHFVCALLEPECSPPPYPPKMPCYNLCKAIIDNCDGQIPRELLPAFNCHQYAKSNCIAAKTPCYSREFGCGDGSCVPRDWICDGSTDCSGGEDEASCVICSKDEYRCRSGNCILKRWMCDGYSDCADGEDEEYERCGPRDEHVVGDTRGEPEEESAGSAPAPAVRRPNRLHSGQHRNSDLHRTVENDSSKELLITSDSNNAFKRNFTRRPSPSRLTPYTRTVSRLPPSQDDLTKKTVQTKPAVETRKTTSKPILENESLEGVNMGDFFAEFEKSDSSKMFGVAPPPSTQGQMRAMTPSGPTSTYGKVDKSTNKMERVIDGAALMRKVAAAEEIDDTPEKNNTSIDKEELFPPRDGSVSAHASPCPSGELRCVDGRCITLAQLCDGTIDCSDHADEDNCFT